MDGSIKSVNSSELHPRDDENSNEKIEMTKKKELPHDTLTSDLCPQMRKIPKQSTTSSIQAPGCGGVRARWGRVLRVVGGLEGVRKVFQNRGTGQLIKVSGSG